MVEYPKGERISTIGKVYFSDLDNARQVIADYLAALENQCNRNADVAEKVSELDQPSKNSYNIIKR
eukprot:8494982-Ditylum_brightwellii.AAC.1